MQKQAHFWNYFACSSNGISLIALGFFQLFLLLALLEFYYVHILLE